MDLSKIIKSNADHAAEIMLLNDICYDISNFSPDFIGRVRKTIVLGPSLSSSFGLEVSAGQLYLGVPSEVFDYFMNLRWYSVCYKKDHPAIFMVFDFGTSENPSVHALRIHVRSGRVSVLPEFSEIQIIKYDQGGSPAPERYDTTFSLSIREITGLEWERF